MFECLSVKISIFSALFFQAIALYSINSESSVEWSEVCFYIWYMQINVAVFLFLGYWPCAM